MSFSFPVDKQLAFLLKQFVEIYGTNATLLKIWSNLGPVTVILNGLSITNTHALADLADVSQHMINETKISFNAFKRWGSLLTVVETTLESMCSAISKNCPQDKMTFELEQMSQLLGNLQNQIQVRDFIQNSSSVDTILFV